MECSKVSLTSVSEIFFVTKFMLCAFNGKLSMHQNRIYNSGKKLAIRVTTSTDLIIKRDTEKQFYDPWDNPENSTDTNRDDF